MKLNIKPYYETTKELSFYFKNWEKILKTFLNFWLLQEKYEVKVLVFGSILYQKAFPALSDIDVLILVPSSKDLKKIRRKWLYLFREQHPFHPFEFHFADPELYQKWYCRFVDKFYEIRIQKGPLV